MVQDKAKIEYKIVQSLSEGRFYRIVIDLSLERFLKSDKYKCDTYNRVFDFLEGLRDKHIPDSDKAVVKFSEEQ